MFHQRRTASRALASVLSAAAPLCAADPPPAQDPSWGDLRIEGGGGAGSIREHQLMTVTPPGGVAAGTSSDQAVRVEVERIGIGQLGAIAGDPRRSTLIIGYEVALEHASWTDTLGAWNSTRAQLDVVAGAAAALGPCVRVEVAALAGAGIARWRLESASATTRAHVVDGGLRADLVACWRPGLLIGAGAQLLGDSGRASLTWTNAVSGDAVSLSEHGRTVDGQGFALLGWRF